MERSVLVAMLIFGLSSQALAEKGKTEILVFPFEFEGLTVEQETTFTKEMGFILADEVQAHLVGSVDAKISTFTTLKSQMKKAQMAEVMACEDNKCISNVTDNLGVGDNVFGSVKRMGNKLHVTLTWTKDDEVVNARTALSEATSESLIATAKQLGVELIGTVSSKKKGGDGKDGSLLVKDPGLSTYITVDAAAFPMGCKESKDESCDADEYPAHEVSVDAFEIMKTEVTCDAFIGFLGAVENECAGYGCVEPAASNVSGQGSAWQPSSGAGQKPVTGVTWYGAEAYCTWVGARLCTEAEWELAARGPKGFIYPWGDEAGGCGLAVQSSGKPGCGKGGPWKVGSKTSGVSKAGVLDMAGNAWEWVADWYGKSYYGQGASKNPKGPAGGTSKVVKGGSFTNGKQALRASNRYFRNPAMGFEDQGFRCCKCMQ